MIWHNKEVSVDFLNQKFNVGLSKHLKMQFKEIGDDFLLMVMQVGPDHWQPFQVLHGGASVVAAETAGSCSANLVIDPSKYMAVGQEINANHIRSFKEGRLLVKAQPIHLGRKSHVWEIKITTEEDKLICISRLTMAIIEKK